MNDFQEKYNNLIDVVASIREHIGKVDPEFLDQHLGEMVSCPQECILLIEQWIKGKHPNEN